MKWIKMALAIGCVGVSTVGVAYANNVITGFQVETSAQETLLLLSAQERIRFSDVTLAIEDDVLVFTVKNARYPIDKKTIPVEKGGVRKAFLFHHPQNKDFMMRVKLIGDASAVDDRAIMSIDGNRLVYRFPKAIAIQATVVDGKEGLMALMADDSEKLVSSKNADPEESHVEQPPSDTQTNVAVGLDHESSKDADKTEQKSIEENHTKNNTAATIHDLKDKLQKRGESAIAQAGATLPEGQGSPIKMMAGMILIAAIGFMGWFMLRNFRRGQFSMSGASLIQVIAAKPIGHKQNIVLLEVAGNLMVLGQSDSGVNMLTELDGKLSNEFQNDVTHKSSKGSGWMNGLSNKFLKSLKNQVQSDEDQPRIAGESDLPNSLAQKMDALLGESQPGHMTGRHQKIRKELHRSTRRKASAELNSKQLAHNILTQMKQKRKTA